MEASIWGAILLGEGSIMERLIYEYIEFLNKCLGGDWFYNTRSTYRFEDYCTDRSLTKKQVERLIKEKRVR